MLQRDVLKTEDWLRTLQQGAELGCTEVQFIGGEPTLFNDLLYLIEKSREFGYTAIELYTNATLLTDTMLDELQSYNVHMATSFYSHLPETHDLITQRRGSFDRTVAAIRNIVKKEIPLRVGIVQLYPNKDHVQEAVKFLTHLGLNQERITIGRVRGEGRGTSLVLEKNGYSKLCGSCWRGKLAISSDGSVYPCVFARQFHMGNILQETLSQILKKHELVNFRRTVHDLFQETEKTTKPFVEEDAKLSSTPIIPL